MKGGKYDTKKNVTGKIFRENMRCTLGRGWSCPDDENNPAYIRVSIDHYMTKKEIHKNDLLLRV